jgi:hypothetical protein
LLILAAHAVWKEYTQRKELLGFEKHWDSKAIHLSIVFLVCMHALDPPTPLNHQEMQKNTANVRKEGRNSNEEQELYSDFHAVGYIDTHSHSLHFSQAKKFI